MPPDPPTCARRVAPAKDHAPDRAQFRLAGRLMGGALAGKLLGFGREIVMARLLGAGMIADGFRGAVTAVLLPIAPLQGDIVPAVLVPLHREWNRTGVAPARFTGLAALFVFIACVLAAAVFVGADAWTNLVVGGFGPEAHSLTSRFVRVMVLAMPASALLVCLCTVEIALDRSRLSSLRPSVQNLSILAGVVTAGLTGKAVAIAWCFVVPFNALAAWGSWTLWREGALSLQGLHPRVVLDATAQLCRRALPLLAQPFAEQGSIWLERVLGSRSGIGVIASLDYARTLTESALFLVSQPIGYAVLASGQDAAAPRRRVEALGRPVLAVAMPVSVFLAMSAPDIVRLVFVRGAFQDHAARLTAGALAGISAGLWATTLGWILLRLLNAQNRNAAAASVLVCAYAANALVNLLLAGQLGPLGLGLGEASRGIVLLGGTVLALGCARLVARMVLQVLPACLCLAWIEHEIGHASASGPIRLLLGAGACAALAGLTLALVSPALAHKLVRRWRRGGAAPRPGAEGGLGGGYGAPREKTP